MSYEVIEKCSDLTNLMTNIFKTEDVNKRMVLGELLSIVEEHRRQLNVPSKGGHTLGCP